MLGTECVIPAVIEKVMGNPYGQLYQPIKTSSTNKLGRFFSNYLGKETSGAFVYTCKGIDDIAVSKSEHWKGLLRELFSSNSGTQIYDEIIASGYQLTNLSANNLKRLNTISANIGEAGITKFGNLLKQKIDMNQMLIHLEKAGSSVDEYSKYMDAIVEQGLFGAKKLPGSVISEKDFFTTYTSDLVGYYSKESNGKYYFLKYQTNTEVGIQIVIDAGTKLLIPVETKVITDELKELIKSFSEQKK